LTFISFLLQTVEQHISVLSQWLTFLKQEFIMALTAEQQAQVELNDALEASRNANQAATEAKRAKLEAVRLAKEVLLENARSKPVDSREVTAADIATFAGTLVAYVNA
jgi:hypothetical protein